MTERPRPDPLWSRIRMSLASSGPGAPLFRRILHRIDLPLLRLTRGRLSLAWGYPVLLLTTTGAKTGQPRTLPLLYVECPAGAAVIGSRFGSTRHPGWYHNLRAHPEATVEIKGVRQAYVARDAREDERAEIWERAVRMYPGYARYASRAHRTIPIVILSVLDKKAA